MEIDIKQVLITTEGEDVEEINVGDEVFVEYIDKDKKQTMAGLVITIYSDGILIDGSELYKANRREIYLNDIKHISKY